MSEGAAMRNGQRLVLGTRGSALAIWQAKHVSARLTAAWPTAQVKLEPIKTTGDKILDVPLASVGGKALFVKEIEEALLEGRVDVAVHSLKDVPADLPAGLTLAATPERDDPADVLISRTAARLDQLRRGARIGTSSLRRQAQLLHYRPDLDVVGIRGNLDTRIRKLQTEGLDAIVLARAGVRRLGLENVITEVLAPEVVLPAVGQGILAVETRDGSRGQPDRPGSLSDAAVLEMVAVLDHRPTHVIMQAERAFLRRLGGGCQVPVAALARLDEEAIHLTGLIAEVDGCGVVRGEARGRVSDPGAVGVELAEDLLDRGGRAILGRISQGEQRG